MKKIAFIFLCVSLCYSSDCQQWAILDVDEGIKPSIALNDDNTPFIAYMNEKIGGFIRVAELQDETFQIANIDDGYFYGPLDIAIDNNGHPRVSYHDHDREDAILMTRASSGWFQTVIVSPNHDGWDATVAIDNFNESHIASVDPVVGLEYAVKDGNSWIIETPGSGAFMYRHSTSIVLTSNDLPNIAYYKDNTNRLEIAKKNGSSWEIGLVETGGRFPSMVLDENNDPIIAYYKRLSGPIGLVEVTSFNNGVWNKQTVDTLNNVELSFSGARNVVSLQIGPEGNLHLSYGDKFQVYYAKRVQGIWGRQLVVDTEGLGVDLGQQTSLAIDKLGFAHITYFERTGNLDGGIIKYANNQNLSMVLIECPPTYSLVCETVADTSITGVPVVLNNPGEEVTSEFTDVLERSGCGFAPDTLFRHWRVSNEFNNFDECDQKILLFHYGREETNFPTEFTYENECFFYPTPNQTGGVSGLCANIVSRFEDSVLTNTCTANATIQRRWFIEDWCEIKLDSVDQLIHFNNYDPISISSLVIFPDNGSSSGSISFQTNCGIPDYSYNWSTGSSEPSLDSLSQGQYFLTVSDAVGCTQTFEFTVPNTVLIPMISGFVRDQNNQVLTDIIPTINFLSGGDQTFEACESVIGESYAVCFQNPFQLSGILELCLDKDDVAAAGTSGLDVVKAQRIILGLVDPCPLNVMAADVNQDGRVSGSDLVIMSRVILGLSSDFTNNLSWRFFIEGTEFPPTENPLDILEANECIQIHENELPVDNINFTGVKLGNLECVDSPLFTSEEMDVSIREKRAAIIHFNEPAEEDHDQGLPIYVQAIDHLSVLQIALDFTNTNELVYDLEMNSYYEKPASLFDFTIESNILKILLLNPEGLIINPSEPLFFIKGSFQDLNNIENMELYTEDPWENELYNKFDQPYIIEIDIKPKSTVKRNESIFFQPNPFYQTGNLTIHFDQPSSEAQLIIYNIQGEKVFGSSIHLEKGKQTISLDSEHMPHAGTYIIHITNPYQNYTIKAVKIR